MNAEVIRHRVDPAYRASAFVYTLYNCHGEVIYVGMTNNWPRRMVQHSEQKAWWDEVARVDLQGYSSRAEAAADERLLIKTHVPAYNTQHIGRNDWCDLVSRHPELEEVETSIQITRVFGGCYSAAVWSGLNLALSAVGGRGTEAADVVEARISDLYEPCYCPTCVDRYRSDD